MNKGIYKFGIIVLGCFVGFCSYSSAHDCHLVGNTSLSTLYQSTWLTKLQNEPIINVFPTENIQRALINLKAYCCRKNILQGEETHKLCLEDKNLRGNSNNAPLSAYLFDHLVDVGLKSLKGEMSDAYPDLIMDQQAIEWREKIHTIASATGGIIPQVIQDEYHKFWNYQTEYESIPYQGESVNAFDTMINQQEYHKQMLQNYNNWSLYTKYHNICSMALFLTFKLAPNNNTNIASDLFKNCYYDLIPELLQKETTYIKNTIIAKSNLLLSNGMADQNQYIYNIRGKYLLDMLSKITIYLDQIYRLVSQGAHKTN